MKMPKFILRVGGCSYVVASNRGVATMQALLAEAVPVKTAIYKTPPEITLEYNDDPEMLDLLQSVQCVKIPRGVVWKRKAKNGEVHVVRPVEKKPKALHAPPRKALPGPQRQALPPPSPQLALL